MTAINEKIFGDLATAVKAIAKADAATTKAKENTVAKTELLVTAAIEIGSLASWDVYRAELDRQARLNKNTAKALGYEEKETKDAGGNITYVTVPCQTLANAFSVIRQAFALAVPLVDGRGEPRSFNSIKSDKKKAAAKVKLAKADDRTKDIVAIKEMLKACMTNLKNIKDPKDTAALRARIEKEVVPMFPTATGTKAA